MKFKDHVIGLGESDNHVQGLYDVKCIDLSPEALQKVEDDTVIEEVQEKVRLDKSDSSMDEMFLSKLLTPD
jgi:hypothetical protein